MRFVVYPLAFMLAIVSRSVEVFGASCALEAQPPTSTNYRVVPAFPDVEVMVDVTKAIPTVDDARKIFALVKPDGFAAFVDEYVGRWHIHYRKIGISDDRIRDEYLAVKEKTLLIQATEAVALHQAAIKSDDRAVKDNASNGLMSFIQSFCWFSEVDGQFRGNTSALKISDDQIPPPEKTAISE